MADTGTDWKPSASLVNLRLRSRIIVAIRHFFTERGVLEVETPLLGNTTATDPHITSFTVPAPSSQPTSNTYFLQTSPEFAMKRLLAAGSGSIFQLGKAFRVDEQGRYHHREFTMLEWYRVGFNHLQLMAEIDALLQTILHSQAADYYTYAEIFQNHLKINPHLCTIADLQNCAARHGVNAMNNPEPTDKDFWLHLLLSHCIEPHLGRERPVFILDFPASQAALAKIRLGNPPLAERFELYYQGIELANGYHELTDANEQRQRFINDNAKRRQLGLPELPIDNNLLAALAAGMPDCAGVALGVDRLVMLAANAESIREVLSFC